MLHKGPQLEHYNMIWVAHVLIDLFNQEYE